jgi:hypothetical protein
MLPALERDASWIDAARCWKYYWLAVVYWTGRMDNGDVVDGIVGGVVQLRRMKKGFGVGERHHVDGLGETWETLGALAWMSGGACD